MIPLGIESEQQHLVSACDSAISVGSGTVDVYATPMVVALMERTCWQSVAPYLEHDQTTVGTRVEIDHLSATPQGMTVRCHSTLTAVEARMLTFKVELFDQTGLIAQGTHQRCIVNQPRFEQKANEKKHPQQ